MLELFLCSMLTILPDFLYRRFAQGKRLGHEINLFTVWYELRWGITLCLILTLSLITTVFYFHPSTKAASAVFRTVTILPETNGRVAETFVEINQRVTEGQQLFRLDSTAQEAAVESAKRKIAEVEAGMITAKSRLAEAEARIVQARGAFQQAEDELQRRAEVQSRSPGSIAEADVERVRVQVQTAQGAVDAALASREAIQSQIAFQLPAEKASAEAALHEAKVALEKTLVVAGTDGMLQQFALRPGDIVNPMLRPAGILVPDRRAAGLLLAGFGQVESQVIKEGMIGEVTCMAIPWNIIPVVVTEVQPVIASGQVRPTDTLVDIQQMARPGSITVIMEPLYQGQLDALPLGGNCIANLYTSNHDRLQDPEVGALSRLGLHLVDTVGLVHALILRMQALLLPFKVLVFGGH
ncbi:MAG: biotin/lipoyl-binding protein [Chromatiaceae bacterium]|jgi:multidrug resistance efflux pump|nr:biotin/lipoyl-binding protein [Chromatiaceae bacterium]